MLKTPLARIICAMRDCASTQTSIVGGSAETEQKELTVVPCLPASPLVVTTATLLATPRMNSRKTARGTGFAGVFGMGGLWSEGKWSGFIGECKGKSGGGQGLMMNGEW